MNRYQQLMSLTGAAVGLSLLVAAANAQSTLTEQSKLAIDGIGPIRVGMTVAEAAKASGIRLVPSGTRATSSQCYYVKPRTPDGLAFMVVNGRIARVDVQPDSTMTTLSGAKNGDSETRIKSLYPGRIAVTPHKYVRGGHYLTFVPKDVQDKDYRLVFETDGKRVSMFRSGKRPEVEFVEGCF